MKSRLVSVLAVAGAMAATGLLFAGAASATNYTANCPGDSGYLQTLINGAGSGDTITIYGTCYGNYEVLGKTNLTLQGGSSGATLNGKAQDRTLNIQGSSVTIRNLTITNGNAPDGAGLIAYDSTLSMTNSTVKGNKADTGAGLNIVISTVDLTGVTVTRNKAQYQGGGIAAFESDLTVTASTVSKNETSGAATEYGGGGIWLRSSNAVLTSTRVTANISGDYGGGIASYGTCNQIPDVRPFTASICTRAGVAGGRASGKVVGLTDGLPSGLSLVNSSVDHNFAEDDGGGIYNESESGDAPLVLQGSIVSFNNAVDGDGGGIYNYGHCGFTASVLSTQSTFQGNQARSGDGGAIYNSAGDFNCEPGTALVTIAQSPAANGPNVVNANQARRGGGFANDQEDGVASLTLQPGATVKGNKASVTGGGVWNNCGSFSSLGQIFLNTPNNVVNTCIPVV